MVTQILSLSFPDSIQAIVSEHIGISNVSYILLKFNKLVFNAVFQTQTAEGNTEYTCSFTLLADL